MDEQEALKLYGGLPLFFNSYYKYSFTFNAIAEDGNKVFVTTGGSSDDIYRYSVDAESPVFLKDGEYSCRGVIGPDGKTLWLD